MSDQEKKNQTEAAPGVTEWWASPGFSNELQHVRNYKPIVTFDGNWNWVPVYVIKKEEYDRMKSALEKIYKNTADRETEKIAREGLGMK